jgi:hypothetical protein
MSDQNISDFDRVKRMSNDEWREEFDGNTLDPTQTTSPIISIHTQSIPNPPSNIPEHIRQAGILAVHYVGKRLLVTASSHISKDLDARIKTGICHLAKIANPDTGEVLYEYTGYRTLFSDKKAILALEFIELPTGVVAERYFNIELRNTRGKSFSTGRNGEFRITGTPRRPVKGSYIKFWKDTVGNIPEGKPSHIYRYTNSALSRYAFTCPNSTPHHDDVVKLRDLRCKGRLYDLP